MYTYHKIKQKQKLSFYFKNNFNFNEIEFFELNFYIIRHSVVN